MRRVRLASVVTAASLVAAGVLGAAGPAVAGPAAAPGPAQACHAPAAGGTFGSRPSAGATPGAPPAAVIRVNQLGYPLMASKLAEIMTRSRGQAPHWELISRGSCRVVAHGVARTDLGPWSHRYPAVWAVKFTGAHRPGTYRLALTTRPAAASPWFRIEPASRLYAGALANALSFYQNERDGPDFIPSALRTAAGHLNDAHAMTFRAPKVSPNGNFKGSLRPYATGLRINATGGWFDAGDYLKFTETTSYTVAMMLQGIASFPARLGGTAGNGHGSFTRRGQVRPGLLAANVGRADQDAVPAGRNRRGEQPLPRGPRHLAAAAGRRSLPRHRPALPVHPAPASLPRRSARRADQPESGRPARGRLRALLPRLPR